jgi:hypothetical protein
MLAKLHAGKRAGGVHVVGRADDHGVNLLALRIQHLSEVAVFLRFWPAVEPLGTADEIDIRQRDDILDSRFGRDEVAEGPATRADSRDVEFFVGRFVAEGFKRRGAAESTRRDGAGE